MQHELGSSDLQLSRTRHEFKPLLHSAKLAEPPGMAPCGTWDRSEGCWFIDLTWNTIEIMETNGRCRSNWRNIWPIITHLVAQLRHQVLVCFFPICPNIRFVCESCWKNGPRICSNWSASCWKIVRGWEAISLCQPVQTRSRWMLSWNQTCEEAGENPWKPNSFLVSKIDWFTPNKSQPHGNQVAGIHKMTGKTWYEGKCMEINRNLS